MTHQALTHNSLTSASICIHFRLPQLLLDLRIRPRSGASAVLHRIASVYPMQTLYALRGSVGDQVFAELFEACIRAEEQNQPVFDHPLQFIIRTTLSTRQADAKVRCLFIYCHKNDRLISVVPKVLSH